MSLRNGPANGPANGNKVWAMKHGTWYSKQKKTQTTKTLEDLLPTQLTQAAQGAHAAPNYTPVETALMKLGSSFLLSLDSKATEEELVLQTQSGNTIYYRNEWRNLFNILDTTILKQFIREKQIDKDKVILDIIAEMCKYGLIYNADTIIKILKPYKDYLYKKNNLHLPKIVVIPATPPGKSVSNCEEHIKSKLQPTISGKNLIHLFPGEDETKIPSLFLIRLLNNLTNEDRIDISKNLQGWLINNPDRELVKILNASCPTPVKIPYYKSICVCKNCKFTVSDSGIDEFLEKEQIASFRNKKNEFLLKTKPAGELLNMAKKFLYIQCHACSGQIPISSIIPKYLDMSKDDKYDGVSSESYKIAEKAKLYLYKIIRELTQKTLDKQFPDLSCCVCLTDNLSYDDMFQDDMCKHAPCICRQCNDAKTYQGRSQRGNFYVNSNYQCLCCTRFHTTGILYIDEFNKTGGVQPGYVGRFCFECIKPFQEKPETCGVEQGNTDISEYCIDCTILLAEYNKKIRLTVICPNTSCNTPISRYDGCDVVECLNCHIQFCYGCEYIFLEPPTFEWNWTCSCIIDNYSRPKQYNDKSQSTCEDRYIEYQYRRGIYIQPVIPLQEVPVPEPEVPVPEPEVPVIEPVREHINININIYNNIIISNPPLEERILDEEDIHRQIQLAMDMDDDDLRFLYA